MAYYTGTADNAAHLLALLADIAPDHGWAIKEQSASRIYLRSVGRSGLDAIYCGIEAVDGTGPYGEYHNWALHGSVSWKSGRAPGEHPGSSGPTYVYLRDADIAYHLSISPQRILMAMEMDGIWQMAHLGLLQPPATDTQYPYPLLIGGCGSLESLPYDYTGAANNSMFWAGNSASQLLVNGKLHLPGGGWADVTVATPNIASKRHCYMVGTNNSLRDMIDCFPDGSYLTEQAFLRDVIRPNIYGQVEGLRRIGGGALASGKIITIDYIDWLCIPDVERVDRNDFALMRLS